MAGRRQAEKGAKRQKLEEYERLDKDLDNEGAGVEHENESVRLIECLTRADEVLDSEKKDPIVGITDARYVNRVSSRILKRAQTLSAGDGHFNGKDLMRKVAQNYTTPSSVEGHQDDDELDWEKLDRAAAKYFAATPSVCFLSHPLCKDEKPRKQRAASQRKNTKAIDQTPNYFHDADANMDKKNTINRQRQLKVCIAELPEPAPLAKMVIDPKSFGQSVENLHTVSCLVSKHDAAIDADKNKNLVVRKPSAQLQAQESENTEPKRRILKFNKKIWKEMINKHNIKEALFQFNPDLDLTVTETQASQSNTQVS
mmetsp:Transcript_57303/g.117260  ORF Transcript_57303/g.117260 Transcript_57303/m.117260 type:complete len:313 (-) Transcript_57303:203-1141(-)|eukprot:CAMPEP_0181313926 /NCGR_PEP_ID=MMETSP1101-20121128/14526_1 /TAXON_ID=46948 /ORGANISM="Rhodomonas abbreviata, Strain Caron Lab Isolate" /LENGTH=312 /DNA_ID=CAMNT_0023420947 /DNA_START=19 /DNA_END=957 /DNA_ORIENTATION=+